MLLQLYVILCTICIGWGQNEVKQERGVYILKNKNFKTFIKKNEHCIVTFYAPWCGPCKTLKPKYERAAKLLSEMSSQAKLAKVDATTEIILAHENGVAGYPTINYYRKGSLIQYTGGREAEDIVKWVTRRTQPALHTLKSTADSKRFTDDESEDILIIGFFKNIDSAEANLYRDAAESSEKFKFGITSSSYVFSLHGASDNQIIMFKKFDNSKAVFKGPHQKSKLNDFLLKESIPLIVELNHQTIKTVLSGQFKALLFLFLSRRKGHYESHLKSLDEIAKEFRNEVLFVSVDVDDPIFARILRLSNVRKGQAPTMKIFRTKGETKFKPDNSQATPENVKTFVKNYIAGKAKEDRYEQDLPDDWNDTPLKILVASNFDSIAFDKTKNVMVDFFAPWCGPCKIMEPEYERLAEMFKDNKTVVIAKIDAIQNEMSHTQIRILPTIKLYTRKDNEMIDYSDSRTAEDMARFIEERAK